MKLYRIPAAALAAMCLLCLNGCIADDFLGMKSSVSESSAADHSAQRYDLEPLKAMAEQLQETKMQTDAEEQMKAGIQEILDEVDKAYAVYIHANMDYYAHWNDKDRSALSDETYADYCVADEIATWAFCNACQKADYDDLLEPYVSQDWMAYYLANNLNRVMSRTRSQAQENGSLLEDYYSTAYSEDVDPDDPAETNFTCAKLYLETLAKYDTSEFLYNIYYRDYTAEETSAMYHDLLDRLLPLYQDLKDYVKENPRAEKLKNNSYAADDPYLTLKQYAPKLSPEIAEAAEHLFSGPYYVKAEGTDAYDGCYTVVCPSEKTAWMYTYLAGDYYDLTSVVHEFGHFNADLRDLTPVYCSKNCIDIAEVQSQGMEMLFTTFYDDIYGEDADYLEALALFNIMDSVIRGFSVGEFEYQIMRDLDAATPGEVRRTFREIMDAAGLKTELYQISHLYEQPGYYISYGVSALAALQIYAQMQENPDRAVDMYTKITHVRANSGEMQFSEALHACGFEDLFSDASLDGIVDTLEKHLHAIIA